jgi:hypothetical protein
MASIRKGSLSGDGIEDLILLFSKDLDRIPAAVLKQHIWNFYWQTFFIRHKCDNSR